MDVKHLEFIQGIISRLAGNSFQMKAWNGALVTAAIGLAAAKDSRPTLVVLAIVPTLAFWYLDAYYLTLELVYRQLYKKSQGNDASFDLSVGPVSPKAWIISAVRPSVEGLHSPMVGIILLVGLTAFLR